MRQLNRELKAFPGVKQKIGVLWETSVRNEGTVCGGTAKTRNRKWSLSDGCQSLSPLFLDPSDTPMNTERRQTGYLRDTRVKELLQKVSLSEK